MYAIATYRTTDGKYVPTSGGMYAAVIADLKTLRGVHRRALRLANKHGRGDLFGFEIWNGRGDHYGTPVAVYTARKLDGVECRVRQYLPLETLAAKANAAAA